MRIVTWNCAGALRRKTAALDALGADVLVVQECENPATTADPAWPDYADWAGRYVWAGKNRYRGIGVFARNGATVEALDWDDAGVAPFLPVRIADAFDLLGVWTQDVKPQTYAYIGQFWQYLQRHRAALGADAVICGDFNSNAIWDRKTRHWNHGDCVRELGEGGVVSLYHLASGDAHGAESRPTYYQYRHETRPYHLDYVFAHRERLPEGWAGLQVGYPAEWLGLSDHMPVIVDL